MQSVFHGIPVFVSKASLCFEVGNKNLRNILKPAMPDRSNWIDKLLRNEFLDLITDEFATLIGA